MSTLCRILITGIVTNGDNSRIFNKILDGDYASSMFDYLTNCGSLKLNDIISMQMFNSANMAAVLGAFGAMDEIVEDRRTVLLPKKQMKVKCRLQEALRRRCSTRVFSSLRTFSFEEFGTLVQMAYGTANRKIASGGFAFPSRHYGSGGALYPVDVYLLVNAIDGLSRGVYRYQPYSASLLRVCDAFDIDRFFPSQGFDTENYSFVVCYAACFSRIYVKYGELALLLALIETGLMSQNLDLSCAAMDSGICQSAGFNRQYAQRLIGADGVTSFALFSSICGEK